MTRTKGTWLASSKVIRGAAYAAVLVTILGVLHDAAAERWWDNLYVRGGYMHIATLDNSSEVELSNIDGPASLAIQDGPIAGSSAGVGSSNLFAVTLGYVLHRWNERVAIEGIVMSIPFPVTFELSSGGTLANESLAPFALDSIPTGVPPLGTKLGNTKAIPPLVTAVYSHFRGKTVQPYVGAGLSYLIPVSCEVTNSILTEVAKPDCVVDRVSFGNLGVVGQVGLEVAYGPFFLNFDVKYIEKLVVSATVRNVYVKTPGLPLYEAVRVGDTTARVGVDPLLLQIAGGARF